VWALLDSAAPWFVAVFLGVLLLATGPAPTAAAPPSVAAHTLHPGAGPGGARASPAVGAVATASNPRPLLPTPIQHVFLILMENVNAGTVYSSAPYERYLANRYAWGGDAAANHGTGYYAICHPSASNYLALTSGQSLECGSDAYVNYTSVRNLFDLLDTAGLPWTSYAESMPIACDSQDSGLYLVRHNPVPYYGDLGGDAPGAVCETHNLPIANLTQDYPYNETPPAFTYIAPNRYNDAHDTGVAVGDWFLSQFVSRLVNTTWFGSSVIFVTYDESGDLDTGYNGFYGGPVFLGSVSNYSRGLGAVDSVNDSHYNLLSTIEWLLGLPPTGTGNDGTAAYPPMKGLFSFAQPLTAQALANRTTGRAPLSVAFDGNASGGTGPYEYRWAFGDGATSSVADPTHTFTRGGMFNVSLNVTDQVGLQASAGVAINVSAPIYAPLKVEVAATRSAGVVPFTDGFSASVSGGESPYGISWSFGDGGSGAGSGPVHTFNQSGNYSVVAQVSDSDGHLAFGSVFVEVYGRLVVDVLLSSAKVAVGDPVQASALVGGGPPSTYTYAWQLGGSPLPNSTGPNLTIRPTQTGALEVAVIVQDTAGDVAAGEANLTVTAAGSVVAPPSGNASSGSGLSTPEVVLAIAAPVAVAAGIIYLAVRQRRAPPLAGR
jgi:PKD repeat protein